MTHLRYRQFSILLLLTIIVTIQALLETRANVSLQVLDQIPDSWSLNLVSEFLVSAYRRLTDERCEAVITKALSGCQSLKMTATVIEELELLKPKIETAG